MFKPPVNLNEVMAEVGRQNSREKNNMTGTASLLTDVEEQKEITRNLFKIKRHLNKKSQEDIISKFKQILSTCIIENKAKVNQINRYKELKKDHLRTRTVLPFTELLSLQLKHENIEKSFQEANRECLIQENQRESLAFTHQRIIEDVEILKKNINKHVYFLLKLNRNQITAERLNTINRFNSMLKESQLKSVSQSLNLLLSDFNMRAIEKAEAEALQKTKLNLLEDSNGVLQVKLKSAAALNTVLKGEIEELELVSKQWKQRPAAEQSMHVHFTDTSKKLIEFFVLRDFPIFKRAFVSFVDKLESVTYIPRSDFVSCIQLKELICKIKSREIAQLSKRETDIKRLYEELTKSIKSQKEKCKINKFQLVDFGKSTGDDIQDLMILHSLLNKMSIPVLTGLILTIFDEINDCMQQNLKCFEEFQQHYTNSCIKYESERSRMSSMIKQSEHSILCQKFNSAVNQKQGSTIRYEMKIRLLFSIHNLIIPFVSKIQKSINILNTFLTVHSADPSVKITSLLETSKEEKVYIKSKDLSQQNAKDITGILLSEREPGNETDWLFSKFPFLNCGSFGGKSDSFAFYNMMYSNFTKFVDDFKSFGQNVNSLKPKLIGRPLNPKTHQISTIQSQSMLAKQMFQRTNYDRSKDRFKYDMLHVP